MRLPLSARPFARLGSLLLASTIAIGLQVAAPSPAFASVTNPILGDLDPANPQANPYAGCIAATLVGNGFTFGSLSLVGADLGTLWPNIPDQVAGSCKAGVDTHTPQICMVPTISTVCTGIGSLVNDQWVAQAKALDTWDLTPGAGLWGGSAINHYAADVPVASGPSARITLSVGQLGTEPCGGVCTTSISELPFIIYGRTPSGAASAFHLHIDDNHGRSYDAEYCFGGCIGGGGLSDPQPLCAPYKISSKIENCPNPSLVDAYPDSRYIPIVASQRVLAWPCIGAPDCSGWQLTMTLTFHGVPYRATSGGVSKAWIEWNDGFADVLLDSATWDDPRWSYTSAAGPVLTYDRRVIAPPAVIDLNSANLACLVGVDVFNPPATFCPDVTGQSAPIVQSPIAAPTLTYVAVGDSYSSGEGAPPFENGTNYPPAINQENTYTYDVSGNGIQPTGCHRSLTNYAKLSAPLLDPSRPTLLVDRTCSGAEIAPTSGVPIVPTAETPGRVSQVDQAISRLNTDFGGIQPAQVGVVSATMGGNDAGFGNLIQACLAPNILRELVRAYPTVPAELEWVRSHLLSCQTLDYAFFHTDDKILNLTTLEPEAQSSLASTFSNARVYQLTYPDFVPPQGGFPGDICGGILQQDANYARSKAQNIDGIVTRTGATTSTTHSNFKVVDLEGAFGANPLCPADPSKALVNGLNQAALQRVINGLVMAGTPSRALLDKLNNAYTTWRDCIARVSAVLGPLAAIAACLNQYNDLKAAWSDLQAFFNTAEINALIGNLATGATTDERFDNSRLLFHPNQKGWNVMSCNLVAAYKATAQSACLPSAGGSLTYSLNGVSLSTSSPVVLAPGTAVPFAFNGFDPGTDVSITVSSQPVDLGTVTADPSGVVTGTLTLPSTLNPGVHKIEFRGTNNSSPRSIEVLARVDGTPLGGVDDGMYFSGFGGDSGVQISYGGLDWGTVTPDSSGGVFVELPMPATATPYSIDVVATGTTTGTVVKQTVTPATLAVTADNKGIVYGDAIPTPTYQTTGFINGENLASSGVTGTPDCSTTATTTSPAGTYPITCTSGSLSSSKYGFAFVPGTLTIAKHLASLTFNGQLFFSTGTGTTAAVTLRGTIVPAPGGTPDPTRAAPVFLLYKSSNTTMATPDVTCAATVSSTGVVTCTLAALGVDNWTVVLQLPDADGYFTAPSSNPVDITVYQPTPGVFATGGGWIVDPSFQNIPVAISPQNNHGNGGFNVRYQSGTTNPSGQANYVFRGVDGYDYVLKSTSWLGGGAAFTATTASFGGTASVTVIDPNTDQAVSGLGGQNFTYRIDVTVPASGTPTYAISIYDATGALYHQAGTTAHQIPLGGGNIVIHS